MMLRWRVLRHMAYARRQKHTSTTPQAFSAVIYHAGIYACFHAFHIICHPGFLLDHDGLMAKISAFMRLLIEYRAVRELGAHAYNY